MKTDRELLELAAKAAGIVLPSWHESANAFYVPTHSLQTVWWNPLTDDGDAFRLQVQLDIHLAFFSKVVLAGVGGSMIPSVEEPIGENKIAATRRAIVRAAAAMQEANEQPVR
jgi:hypothetical protein